MANPEKVVVNIADDPVKPAPKAEPASSGASWKIAVAVIATTVVVLGIGLGVGLGVGLRNKDNGDDFTAQRTLYIAAEEIEWDYAPSKKNLCYDTLSDFMEVTKAMDNVGGTWKKAMYQEYTDSSFTVGGLCRQCRSSTSESHLWAMG